VNQFLIQQNHNDMKPDVLILFRCHPLSLSWKDLFKLYNALLSGRQSDGFFEQRFAKQMHKKTSALAVQWRRGFLRRNDA
ncbi:hypothetical protein A9Q89_06995, partial [Gammaproteobacteria bacterium 53_120_T64]